MEIDLVRIKARGKGRAGGLQDGLGKLEFLEPQGFECRQLQVVYESAKDFGFQIPIMWAINNQKLTKSEVKVFEKLINRIEKEFLEFVNNEHTPVASVPASPNYKS